MRMKRPLALLLASAALGVPPGLGTAITVLGTGLVMDLVFKCLGFVPRAVRHENLPQTCRALAAAARTAPDRHLQNL